MQDMSLEEKQLITDLNKCDFGELLVMHKQRVEARKNMSKEEKQVSGLPKHLCVWSILDPGNILDERSGVSFFCV